MTEQPKMNEQGAILILTTVAAIWVRHPLDRIIKTVWSESLAGRVTFEAAAEAVRAFRDSGRQHAPTPGEIYREAAGIDKRAEDERRRRTHLLEEPRPSPEERKRVAEIIRNSVEKLGGMRKAAVPVAVAPDGGTRKAAVLVAVAPDAETLRAQEVILEKRRELGIGGAK